MVIAFGSAASQAVVPKNEKDALYGLGDIHRVFFALFAKRQGHSGRFFYAIQWGVRP